MGKFLIDCGSSAGICAVCPLRDSAPVDTLTLLPHCTLPLTDSQSTWINHQSTKHLVSVQPSGQVHRYAQRNTTRQTKHNARASTGPK